MKIINPHNQFEPSKFFCFLVPFPLKGEGNKNFSTMRKIPGCIRTNLTKQKNIALFTSKSI